MVAVRVRTQTLRIEETDKVILLNSKNSDHSASKRRDYICIVQLTDLSTRVVDYGRLVIVSSWCWLRGGENIEVQCQSPELQISAEARGLWSCDLKCRA